MKKNKTYKIGIDIGGTKMSAVLFDGKKVIDDYKLSTPKESLEQFLVMLKAVADPLLERAKKDKVKVSDIGLGLPAVLSEDKRQVLFSPNLEIIMGADIIAKAAELFGLPVLLDNDVNCFLRAEMKSGVGHKYQNTFGITIGTGIGGAWWYNGNIYKGAFGGGGEPGHMIIDHADKIDFETAYHKLTQNNPASMAEEAFRGDTLAEKTFNEVGEMLGVVMANVVNLLEPEAIIIGGGVSESDELFLGHAKKEMRKHLVSEDAKKRIRILKTKLGPLAGAVGAAMLE